MKEQPRHRDVLKRFGAGTALLAAAGTICAAAPASEDGERPNIIFIMLDDMGYGDVGVYGQKHIQMPNVDRMAREGIRYTDVYAGSPICAPVRSTLMTGQHTGHTRVRGNAPNNDSEGAVICTGRNRGLRQPLLEEDTTVPAPPACRTDRVLTNGWVF